MLDLKSDIKSLTVFKRDTAKLVKQMKRSGNPIVLTVNGKAELVVQDADSYQDILDRLEAIEGIKRGLQDMKAGRTKPASQVHAEMRRHYEVQD